MWDGWSRKRTLCKKYLKVGNRNGCSERMCLKVEPEVDVLGEKRLEVEPKVDTLRTKRLKVEPEMDALRKCV